MSQRQSTGRINFKGFNSKFEVFQQRALQHQNQNSFAAGIFLDHKQKVLMVRDQQELGKIWLKLPEGVPDINCLRDQDCFIQELVKELEKMKYPKSLQTQILEHEKTQKRNGPEKGLILEMVEETGYYPTRFGYVCDGYRYNVKETGPDKFNLYQVFFHIQSVISPNSKDINQIIKQITDVKTLEAIDQDVKDMRVKVDIENALEKLGPDTHKEALTFFFKKQERYYHANDNFDLSKKYAMGIPTA